MSDLEIEVEDAPFLDWMGPYSPARGMQHGLRFHGGELGVWSNTPTGKEFGRFNAMALWIVSFGV